MKRMLIIAGSVIALLVAFLVWRLEPLYLAWLAGQTETGALEDRRALISDSVEIHVPDTDEETYPTALLLHGCAGPRMAFQRQWAKVFTDAGYAAMIVDSVGPRGYSREKALEVVCAGKALIGQERAGDIYAAIEIARADPRLDADNIVLAGWSHGAWSVMDFLTMDGGKRRPAGLSGALPPPAEINGAVLFYPHCGTGALSRLRPWRQSPPTLALIAGADTIVDADKCISLFNKKKNSGAAIEMTVYPDAEHVFDDPFLEPEWFHWYDEDDHQNAEMKLRQFLAGLPN